MWRGGVKGDSLASKCTPQMLSSFSGQVSTKELLLFFLSTSIFPEREIVTSRPHALLPGGHSNTLNAMPEREQHGLV